MTRVRTDLLSLLIVVSFTMCSGRARAEPIRASLTVTRDDGSRECPDSANLASRVETVAGKSLFDAASAEPRDTWVQVEFVRAIGGFHAVISARGSRQGTRALDDVGPDCASLADAVAITLAILLDPAMATKSDPPPLAVATPAVASPLVDAAPPRAPAAPKKKLETSVVGVEVSAGPSFAILEGVVPLVEGGVRGRLGDVFVLGGGVGAVFPESIAFGSGEVDVSLTYGYVRACANLLPRKPTTLEVCAEPMLGALRGSGRDYETDNHVEWVFWSAAAALVQAYGPISESVFWSLRARILAPLARHGFSVSTGDSPEQAFQLSRVGGSLTFGVEVEL